ncbi:MAG: porin [Candidatus Edwardsbacteria bacterium]|nr:porin [Candidatus Edwardsbacteria bacterium]
MKRIFLLAMVFALAGSAFAFDVKTDAKQAYPTFKVSGWLKITYMDTLYHDTLVAYPSGFEAKDAAITVSGDAWQDLSYRICLQSNKATKVSTSTVYAAWLLDAYAEWKPSKLYSFRVGQYKRPFGFEQLTAATGMDFIGAAQITGKFNTSNREVGVMGFGVWNDLNYFLSLGNGSPYNEKDANASKTVLSKIVYAPLAGMTMGGSVEYGTQNTAGKSYYNRHAGLEANYERGQLFARGELMIGQDDKVMALDSVMVGSIWVYKSSVDLNLMRGGYLTVGYVPLSKLKVNVRGDFYRENCQWDLVTDGTNAWWDKKESRVIIYNLGADYYLNPNTKVTLNYDIKQEDMALRPVKNNILSAQLQVKF